VRSYGENRIGNVLRSSAGKLTTCPPQRIETGIFGFLGVRVRIEQVVLFRIDRSGSFRDRSRPSFLLKELAMAVPTSF
jgi:hypothetical protein